MPSVADRRLYAITAAVVIVLDLVTKAAAEAHLLRVMSVPVIGDWFQLRLVYNPGAAFGFHLGPFSRYFFIAFAVAAVAVLNAVSRGSATGDRLRQFACGLVTGGAIGNMLDRLRGPRGVVDFLDIGVGSLRWPTFNVADIAVTCGAITLALLFWREDLRRSEAASAG